MQTSTMSTALRRLSIACLLLSFTAAGFALAGPKDAPAAPSDPNAAAAAAPATPAAPADPGQPADPNAPQPPADEANYVVTRMRVQDFPAATYLYSETEATINTIGQAVESRLPPLLALVGEGKVRLEGSVVFVYQGATHDPNKPFMMQIGMQVPEGTKDEGDFKVRRLEPLHAASVIFSGPMRQIAQGYQQLFGQLMAAGLTPTGETREVYLYWEGMESPNNVVMIQAAVNQ